MNDDAKAKVAAMLLQELQFGEQAWYYISVADRVFKHGVFVRAFGPTDARCILHSLNLYVPGCSTSTMGPMDTDMMSHVPESKRWRKLTEEEVCAL